MSTNGSPINFDELTQNAAAIVDTMTIGEKIGQMTQVEKNSLSVDDVGNFFIGSVLSGGGGNPDPNTPDNWWRMVTDFKKRAETTRLGIPLLYGVDGVHGHNNVYGATIFPHNIGLGATSDPVLVEQIGRATAVELAATGVRWNFAPAVPVPQDIRWGRTYEGYSEQSAMVCKLAAAYVAGLQDDFGSSTAVLASLKHYAGDGGTAWDSVSKYDWIEMPLWANLGNYPRWTLDQGQTIGDETMLRDLHLPPYQKGIEAGALNVMASYSSFQGVKCHAHKWLLTDVLKGEFGFKGFVVSDWMALDQLHADYPTAVAMSINAGVDMVMVPFDFKKFIAAIRQLVADGRITEERIDDAVTRILLAKLALNLWEENNERANSLDKIGSEEHRQLARTAVQKSQVLLKNNGVLPVSNQASSILVAGNAINDIGIQCGGWTIEWQGASGAITEGTSILKAIQKHTAGQLIHAPDGDVGFKCEVGIVAVGELPYAEGEGDCDDLPLTREQIQLIKTVRSRVENLVLLIVSGRPLIISEVIEDCDAIVACWLPGTEGDGIADTLFGLVPFSGRLSYTWPESMADVANPQGKALFPYGFGLTT